MYGRRYTHLMSSAICGNVPWRVYVIKPENKRSQRLEVKKVSNCSSWCFWCFWVLEGHGKNQKQLLIVCQFHLRRAWESCGTIFRTVLPELGTWRLSTQNQLGLVQVWILSMREKNCNTHCKIWLSPHSSCFDAARRIQWPCSAES